MTQTGPSPHVATAVGVWCCQLILTAVSLVWMFFSQLSVASCSPTSCDYEVYSLAINTFYTGAVSLLVAAAIMIFPLRRRGRLPILSPTLGILLLVVLLITTYAISRAALDLPLFGNRLSPGS
jgi:hypothetical protein